MKGKEKELENNVFFWQKLDTLILSCTRTHVGEHVGEHFCT